MAWKAVRRDRRAVFRLWSVATTVAVLALSAGCSSSRSAATVAEPPAAARAGVASPAASVVADPRLPPAVRAHEAYLREQAAALPARTRPFTDAVRAGDVTRAKTLYAASRAG